MPISLLVTLEMVKFIQGKRIAGDENMIAYNNNNIPATVQSSRLNEELGKISYIFSDKTGTLTCNYMEFKNLCVHGVSYGDKETMTEEEASKLPKVSNVRFLDQDFLNVLKDPLHPMFPRAEDCLIHLTVCHTVIAEAKGDDLVYNASSPDELALLNFAKFCGYVYKGTDEGNNIVVAHNGKVSSFKLLHVLEFNSTRKRMSVIVETEKGEIELLTKGADSIILGLMNSETTPVVLKKTIANLEEYAVTGLRTLVLAKKKIEKRDYELWKEKYTASSLVMDESREELMMNDMAEIEKGVSLVGATANLDKLQDEVGLTISILKEAGIKVWVLTGDKVETAINIGYSCKLLSNSMQEIRIDGKTQNEVLKQIESGKKLVGTQKGNGEKFEFALVVTGESLIAITEHKMTKGLMEIAQNCKAVIACRVSPKQKQEVVSMARKEVNPLLFSIQNQTTTLSFSISL